MSTTDRSSTSAYKPSLKPLPALIFFSRWLQLPLYLGLIVAQGVYVYLFVIEVWHLLSQTRALNETAVMLAVLSLIDVVMISNLLIMVIIGGYETFVSRLGLENHPDEPEWLDHVNARVLKGKLAMALICILSIHLLKTFIDAGQRDTHTVVFQILIHLSFLLSAAVMAWVDKIMSRPYSDISPSNGDQPVK